VIERQWSMLKTNNDLIETMSEALWPQPKGEEKTMIHD